MVRGEAEWSRNPDDDLEEGTARSVSRGGGYAALSIVRLLERHIWNVVCGGIHLLLLLPPPC